MTDDTRTETRARSGPAKLGRFELVKRIATGGMAEVFLAREHGMKGLQRAVVIKRILPHLAEKQRFVDMFLQEARIIAQLNHPNIVQIFELGEEDGTYFIAMEYVAGSSFRQLMRKSAKADVPIPIDVALGLMTQACAGAHAAHELKDSHGAPQGLVHRDISPHNLMVSSRGHVKLLDFGIAKATEIALENTRTGALKGKVHYMSPEQCQQTKDLDRRSDIFALGIVLWELLTARRLFKRDSELSTMQAIVTGEVWDPREFRPDLSEDIAKVCLKALKLKRSSRFETADAMRLALDEAARSASMPLSNDKVAVFVHDVLGSVHEKTAEEVQDAMERTFASNPDEHDLTVADRPTMKKDQGGSESKSRGSETLPPTPSPLHMAQLAQQQSGPTLTKVVAFLGLSLVVAAMVVGGYLWLKNRSPTVAGEVVKVGWAPTVDQRMLANDIEPLRIYLEQETGRPVQFVFADSYDDLSQKLQHGVVHFASIPPFMFLLTKEQEPKVEVLAVKLFAGSSGSDGVLLAREGLTLPDLTALKGKTLCYPDENSTTGYILPRAKIREAGVDPDADMKAHRSGNHMQLLRDLVRGVCDVGGTYSGAYLSASGVGVNVAPLRQLGITGRAPQDGFVKGPNVNDRDAQLFKRALLRFSPQRLFGREVLGEVEKISGFNPASEKDFDALRKAVRLERDATKARETNKKSEAKGVDGAPTPTDVDAATPDAAEPKPKPKKKRKKRRRR